jgi:WD40 repeat protein
VTALKCKKEEILSGNRNGELKIHNLKYGDQQPSITYKYHREKITDCCWLTMSEGNEGQFLSSSTDGIIYL